MKPDTVRFSIPEKSLDFVQKRKSALERKHCTRIIVVSKSDQVPSVIIHGLKEHDITSCREEIEESLFVARKFPLNQHQLLFLRNKRQQVLLDELQTKCYKVSLPPAQSERGNKDPYILVKGKVANVDTVWELLDQTVGKKNFEVKIFSLKCVQCFKNYWMERWSTVAKEFEEARNVCIRFAPSGGPGSASSERDHRHQSSETYSLINFEVMGDRLAVEDIVESIKQNEGGDHVEMDIDKQVRVQDLLKGVQMRDLKVWFCSKGSKLIVMAPSFAKQDLDVAKARVLTFLAEGVGITENVACLDQLAFDIMMSNHTEYLDSTNMIAKKNHVTIRINKKNRSIVLEGAKSDVEVVKPVVEKVLNDVQKDIQTQSIHVTAIQAPFLKTSVFTKVCAEFKIKQHVEISTYSNTLLVEAFINQRLKVSIIKGDLLAENVDGIVNAANEDLAHIGGLAKAILDAAGPEMQKECFLYVSMNGKVRTGNAACLGAGNLHSCRNIIHAVAPQLTVSQNIRAELYSAVKNALLASAKAGHCSIALPALGTGIFGIPVTVCAEVSIKAVEDFSNEISTKCSLKDVRFILNMEPACDAFVRRVKQHLLTVVPPSVLQNPFSVLQSTVISPSQQTTKIWKWMDDSGQYQPYDATNSALLTKKYTQNSSGVFYISINSSPYVIDLGSMEQINVSTKHRRKIVLQTAESTASEYSSDIPGMAPVSEQQSNVQWYYKGDRSQWEAYLPQHVLQLESWYQSNESGTLRIGRQSYSFDFQRMVQTNVVTKKAREMKRVPEKSSSTDDTPAAKWFFQNDSSQFQPYSAQDSAQLEEWYQSSATPGRLTIFGNVYRFDFTKMEQVNITTSKVRKIKREGEEVEERKTFKSTTILLRGDRKNINDVQRQIQSKLEKCLVSESVDLPKSVGFASIEKVALRHPVECSFANQHGDKPVVKITGVHYILQKCKTEIQSAIISKLESVPASHVKFPEEWQDQQQSTVKVFLVQEGSVEWNQVTSKFKQTMPDATIVSVERVQNKWLWEKYSQHKEMLRKKNNGAINEMQLFHGTRNNDPKLIYSSEEGFDMRFCASGMWGQANYFAVNASYSDNYSHTCAMSGNQQMFLASVLTGESHQCSSNSSLRMPPEKAKTTYAHVATSVNLDQVRYDTVTGNTNGSTVYMTYDNLKAYPAYLITYQRAPRRFGFF